MKTRGAYTMAGGCGDRRAFGANSAWFGGLRGVPTSIGASAGRTVHAHGAHAAGTWGMRFGHRTLNVHRRPPEVRHGGLGRVVTSTNAFIGHPPHEFQRLLPKFDILHNYAPH